MFAPDHDFHRALDQSRKAARRGDHAAATHWLKLAERHAAVALRRVPPGLRHAALGLHRAAPLWTPKTRVAAPDTASSGELRQKVIDDLERLARRLDATTAQPPPEAPPAQAGEERMPKEG